MYVCMYQNLISVSSILQSWEFWYSQILSSIGDLNSSILVGQGLKIWFFCKKQDGGIKRGCVAYQRVYMIKASIHHFYKHTSYKLQPTSPAIGSRHIDTDFDPENKSERGGSNGGKSHFCDIFLVIEGSFISFSTF